MPPFRDPLPEGSIRLLRILPSTDEHSPIQCQLFECTLLDSGGTHPYEALSYVWGFKEKPRSISVDNCDLAVGANLHAALSHLRDHYVERIMWIDAICINQEDPKEKAHQVQFMARIYAKANRVTVWLGEAAADSDQALEEIRQAADKQSKSSDNETAILAILQRQWFQRIWVLQEVAAARHVLIKCGHAEIDGYVFWSGLRVLNLSYETCPDLQPLVSPVTYLIRNAIFRPKYISIQPDRFSLNIRPLSELVVMHHTRKTTEPLDKVYALLGMSSDRIIAELSVNYKITWAQLLERLVKSYIPSCISVYTGEEKEIAVMKCKGCVLGEVSSVKTNTVSDDEETFVITWRDMRSSPWTLQALPMRVQVGDIVCLLQGASRHTILRLHNDYWVVIRIAISLTDIKVSEPKNHDFLMVWVWDIHPGRPQDGEDYQRCMVKRGLICSERELDNAARLQTVGRVLHDMKMYEAAREKFRKALEAFEKDLVCACHNRGEGEGEGEGEVEKPLINDSGGWAPQILEEKGGREMFVEMLLESREIDPNAEYAGQTPLWIAAEDGHAAVVRVLLKSKTPVHPTAKDKNGRTVLWHAAAKGHAAVVKVLLESGQVGPDAKDKYGWKLLSWVEASGQDAVVKMLRESGRFTLDSKSKDGWTLSSHEAVVALQRYSSKPNLDMEITNTEQWWLWMAAVIGHELLVTKQLGSNLVAPDVKDKDRRTPLWWAAEKGHAAVVKVLVDSSQVNPDAKDRSGQTPLWIAAENGHAAVVKVLVDSSQVNPDVVSHGGQTPLLIAAENGHAAVVKVLVNSSQVNPNAANRSGLTPICWAAYGGHEEVVKVLVNSGRVNPHIPDTEGQTPLWWAAWKGHTEVVKILVNSGRVDPDIRDARGQTPLWWAAWKGHTEVVKILVNSGRVDPDIQDAGGQTPLWWAAWKGHTEVVKVLVDSGQVNPDIQDKGGQTPLQIAMDKGYTEIIKILVENS